MRRSSPLLALAATLGATLAAVAALGATLAAAADRAEGSPPGPRLPVSRTALRAALCPHDARCTVERIVDAGERPGRLRLAVVRVRVGRSPVADEDCRPYRDWLVRARGARVVARRELVRGNEPCLEWQRSEWAFDGEALTFTYSGMGAPPSAHTDMRPTHVRFAVWPLAAVGAFAGEREPRTPPIVPRRGPILTLTME